MECLEIFWISKKMPPIECISNIHMVYVLFIEIQVEKFTLKITNGILKLIRECYNQL